ncbi:MAG: hypothetical protein RL557_196 [archaeon]
MGIIRIILGVAILALLIATSLILTDYKMKSLLHPVDQADESNLNEVRNEISPEVPPEESVSTSGSISSTSFEEEEPYEFADNLCDTFDCEAEQEAVCAPVDEEGNCILPCEQPDCAEKSVYLLSARDSGLYATAAWGDPLVPLVAGSSLDRTKDLTFAIISVNARTEKQVEEISTRIQQVKQMVMQGLEHDPQKISIIRIDFWGPEDGRERHQLPLAPAEEYEGRVMKVLAHMENEGILDKIYGISLSEENVPRDGRQKILFDIYTRIKEKYPSLQVYVWWIPNLSPPDWYKDGSLENPDERYLAMDGWIIDPYTLSPELYPDARWHYGNDPYKRLLEKYVVTGKPVIAVLYASSHPDHSWKYDPTNLLNKAKFNMSQLVDHQSALLRAYNIPMVFYWINAKGKGVFPLSDADSDPLLQKINTQLFRIIAENKALPFDYTGDSTIADVTSDKQAIVLSNQSIAYTDNFRRSTFIDHSAIRGFRDLVWKPFELGVRGFNERRSDVALVYHFTSTQPLQYPKAILQLTLDETYASTVMLSFSVDGNEWQAITERASTDDVSLVKAETVSLPAFANVKEFWIKIEIEGDSGSLEKPIARLTNFSIVRP